MLYTGVVRNEGQITQKNLVHVTEISLKISKKSEKSLKILKISKIFENL